jgi:hypothetical protein
MILLEINPLSKHMAMPEIIILMIASTGIGWLTGWWVTHERVRILRETLAARTSQLEECSRHNKFFADRRKSDFQQIVVSGNLKAIDGTGPKTEPN